MKIKSSLLESLITFTPPTGEEIFNRTSQEDKSDPNTFSNWFSRLKTHFKTPRSVITSLTFDEMMLLKPDEKSTDQVAIQQFNDRLNQLVQDAGLHYPIFMKNGVFSNKFDFEESCLINSSDEFFDNLYNIIYGGCMVGARLSNEVVLRELVIVPQDVKIYNAMPLNIEFRAFVNFDTQEIVEILDYWHDSIASRLPPEQVELFKQHKETMAPKFEQFKAILHEELQNALRNKEFDLNGSWSVDFLLDANNELWLIDMAFAGQSWGIHLLTEEQQAKLM